MREIRLDPNFKELVTLVGRTNTVNKGAGVLSSLTSITKRRAL